MTVFTNKDFDKHEQVVFCHDHNSGLKAIIGVHNTVLGPALGGTRLWPYATEEEALTDVLRLSKGMTYKAAVSGLNLGGGKAVIIADPKDVTEQMFRAFGRFVNSLNGRYITAEDVNTNTKHMEWIHLETEHVTGIPACLGGSGDPSPVTAHGTFVSIKAALKKVKGSDSLKGIKVAVQGAGGHVGYYLCKELNEAGAIIIASDINKEALNKVVKEFGATAVGLDDIYGQAVDVYSPCALGATINDKTIPQFKCSIIAGAANNQLHELEKHGNELKKLGILYAPDYVANAGGLMNVSGEIDGRTCEAVTAQVDGIYDTMLEVFALADKEKISTAQAANKMAEMRIAKVGRVKDIYC
jgi:leucine dehydrogenase